MRLRELTIRQTVIASGVAGAASWTVYGIVECWFSTIVPWLVVPSLRYEEQHSGFAVFLFVLYAALGFLAGGACGLVLRAAAHRSSFLSTSPPAELFEAATGLTVLAAFAANHLFHNGRPSLGVLFGLPVALVLLGLRVRAAGSEGRARALGRLGNRWTVSLVLVGPPYVTKEWLGNSASRPVAFAAVTTFVAAVLALTLAASWARDRLRGWLPAPAFRPGVVLPLGILFSLAVSLLCVQTPLSVAADPLVGAPSARPSVLLISLDTVRADHMSLYGYEHQTTPSLERLSRNATLYRRAIAAADTTLASHASMFTGLYAIEHGAHYSSRFPAGRPLPEKFPTLAEILSSHGYEASAVVSNFTFLGYGHRLARGFRYYDARNPAYFLTPKREYHVAEGVRTALARVAPRSLWDGKYRPAARINAEVLALLEGRPRENRPFFFFVNYMDAHYPYLPPPPFDRLYPGMDETFRVESYKPLRKQVNSMTRVVTDNERRHLVSQYDGGIAYVDSQVGSLIERLKELGAYEDCLIIVTGDHGETFGERSFLEHGVSVYQDQVHVPLLIKFPGQREPAVVEDTVSHVDLLPTVLDVVGLQLPQGVSGRTLRGPAIEQTRHVLSESFPAGVLGEWHPRFHRDERALFAGSMKLVISTAGKRELYDLSRDPAETRNLYRSDEAIAKELGESLNRWVRSVPLDHPEPSTLDRETLQRLRSLGYTQ